MTYIQSIILGITQGLTEFFPVSSSAHLRIVKKILGISDGEHLLFFDLICHLGTLFALILFLRKEIWSVLCSIPRMCLYALALLPLVPAYFFLKPIRQSLSNPAYLGYFLMLTGAILLLTKGVQTKSSQKTYGNALWIGIAQTAALIPGISRSGITIATSRFLGWNLVEGAKFSFLLVIPAVLGGQLLESIRLWNGSSEALGAVSLSSYVMGFLSSLIIGLFSVKTVFWIYEKGKLHYFGWYCLCVGIFALILFRSHLEVI